MHGVLVMGYSGFTTLFNLVVLAWALGVLRRLRLRTKGPGPQACRDTVTVLGLTVLLGTTWALAFFSFGVFLLPQLFLFSIFNSLYGRRSPWACREPTGIVEGGTVFIVQTASARWCPSAMCWLGWRWQHPSCWVTGGSHVLSPPFLPPNRESFCKVLLGPREALLIPGPEVLGSWAWPLADNTSPTNLPFLAGFFFFLWFCSQKYRSEVEVKAEMEALSSS